MTANAAPALKAVPTTARSGLASSQAVRDVEHLGLSLALARYGDTHRDPLALILGARIFKELGAQAGPSKSVGADPAAKAAPPSADLSAEDMLARARKLAGERRDLLALIDDVSKGMSRGCVSCGPRAERAVIKAQATDQFVVHFRGGEEAVFRVSPNGDEYDEPGTTLDLYVYDENGKRVCADAGPASTKLCRWTPRWDGPYTIRVVNRGQSTEYQIRSNQ